MKAAQTKYVADTARKIFGSMIRFRNGTAARSAARKRGQGCEEEGARFRISLACPLTQDRVIETGSTRCSRLDWKRLDLADLAR